MAVISRTPEPQISAWRAMHQDYSEDLVDHTVYPAGGNRGAGEACVKHLLEGGRGHYGPLEHQQIVFSVGYYPHSVMQQARTHRVGVSFDVQSMRYTGNRICQAARGEYDLERAFYLRPIGTYASRSGHYDYTAEARAEDLERALCAARHYDHQVTDLHIPHEHARSMLPFDFRQHFIVSFTLRALMHFLDLRSKLDAQHEIVALTHQMMPCFQRWAPQFHDWYAANRFGKAKLAP